MLLKEYRRKIQKRESSLSMIALSPGMTHYSPTLRAFLFPHKHTEVSCCFPCHRVSLSSLLIPQYRFLLTLLNLSIISLSKLASTYEVFPSYKPHTMGVDLLCCHLCEREQ